MTQILKPEFKKILKTELQDYNNNSVGFSPDGKYVVSGCSDNTVRIWDVITGDNIHVLKGHTGVVHSAAFSPDGKSVISGSEDDTIRIWDVASPTWFEKHTLKKKNVPTTEGIFSVAFNPDEIFVASGGRDKTVRIWDTTYKDEVHILEHSDAVVSLAFSPNGAYIASGERDIVRIWDVDFGMVEKELVGHKGFISSIAFSPDSKYMVSGAQDTTVRIWEIDLTETVESIIKYILTGHSMAVKSVAFSPDGKYVVSGAWDKTVRIWDVILGKEIHKIEEKSPITTVAFSPIITFGYTLVFAILAKQKSDSNIHLYHLKEQTSPFHTSLQSTSFIESVSMPSTVDDFIEGEQSLSKYEYDIKNTDFPILFTDKKFFLKVMMKSRLENILEENQAIFYECKKDTKTTSLFVSQEDVHPQPYIKTTVFGLETVGDALIKIENIQKILKDSKKIRLKERQKQAIRTLREGSFINNEKRNQSYMVDKANSVLKIEKIPPRIYTFVETKTKIKRVASKAVLESGSIVSAKHCQEQDEMMVYTLKRVYKKRTKKRKYPKITSSVSRKNRSL